MKYKVIMLTGASATGKSTLSNALEQAVPTLQSISYGKLLFSLKKQEYPNLTYEELRSKSAQIVTPKDIANLDNEMLVWLAENRKKSHIIIDSHSVTAETYGFRITPYGLEQVARLKFDAVVSLYCSFRTMQARIEGKSRGRPLLDESQFNKHITLQDSIANMYGIISNCPIYHIDTANEVSTLLTTMLSILDIN